MFNVIDTIIQAIIGNGIYDFIKKMVVKDKQLEDKTKIEVFINNSDTNLYNKSTKAKEIKNEVGERLIFICDSMEAKNSLEKYNIDKLASLMGCETSEELNEYVKGNKYPPFEFLDKFASCFGINLNWLKFGESHPYRNSVSFETYAEDYYSYICEMKPKKIIWVRSNSKKGEVIIILKISEYMYIMLPSSYHISSYVGDTGKHQIYSFYKLLKRLKSNRLRIEFTGRMIDEEDFNSLCIGDVFPGKYDSIRDTNNLWWDDFTDVYNKYDSLEKYKEWYGEEFIKAQLIVKECIKEND